MQIICSQRLISRTHELKETFFPHYKTTLLKLFLGVALNSWCPTEGAGSVFLFLLMAIIRHLFPEQLTFILLYNWSFKGLEFWTFVRGSLENKLTLASHMHWPYLIKNGHDTLINLVLKWSYLIPDVTCHICSCNNIAVWHLMWYPLQHEPLFTFSILY